MTMLQSVPIEESSISSLYEVPEQGENAASRWALLVVRVIDCPVDPRNLRLWGRCVGASVSTLRSRCITLGITTKASLDFARLLRALVRSAGSAWDPSIELDVYDPRTLRRLLEEGGIAVEPDGVCAPPLRRFLDNQRLVHHVLALQYVTRELSDRGLL